MRLFSIVLLLMIVRILNFKSLSGDKKLNFSAVSQVYMQHPLQRVEVLQFNVHLGLLNGMDWESDAHEVLENFPSVRYEDELHRKKELMSE